MRLIVSGPAEADIEEITDYIAANNPPRAVSFARELWDACEELLRFPESYPLLRTKLSGALRQRIHGNYRIVFFVGDDSIEVLRVLHGARDYERILFPDGD